MGVTEGTQRRGRKEETRRATTQHSLLEESLRAAAPGRSDRSLSGGSGALLFTQRGSFLPVSPMLNSGRMEEFVTEEEEPWYDQQDLEQGKASPQHPHWRLLAPAGQLAST